MNNPGNALLLYVLVVVSAFLLSPRWAGVRSILQQAGTVVQSKGTPATK